MFSKKTTYSFTDENKKLSTITINKFDADILQSTEKNVHKLIQIFYDKVFKLKPQLSRRKRGDLVRICMARKAQEKPLYKVKLNQYL